MGKIKIYSKRIFAAMLAALMVMSSGFTGIITYSATTRGDFKFTKKEAVGSEEMTGVLFSITDGNETHYFVTDENGEFNSSISDVEAHTTSNVNGNDAAITTASDGTITVDESALSSDYGIWFGSDAVSASSGALPTGTYTVTEIRTSANTGYTLISFTVEINSSGTDDEGTYYDKVMNLETEAYVSATGLQIAPADDEVSITDSVSIENLEKNEEYTLKLALYDADTLLPYEDSDGNTYTVSQTFTTTTGIVSNKLITFSKVDLTGAEGKELVIYAYLYDSTGLCIYEAADISDRAETIYVAEITTTALDTENYTHMSDTDTDVQITDSFTFSNLLCGKSYIVVGVLYVYDDDESEAKPLYNPDDPEYHLYTAYTKVTADTQTSDDDGYVAIGSGSGSVTFTLDSSELDGKTVVVYEYLYLNAGYGTETAPGGYTVGDLYAWETDATNEDESIHFASISTDAYDFYTEDNVGTTTKTTTIIDTVSLGNIITGETYKITATVVSQNDDGSEGDTILGNASTVFTVSEDGKISPSSSDTDETYKVVSVDADGAALDGYITVTISGISADQGDTYVVYEDLWIWSEEKQAYYLIGEHEEIADEDQTIHYPLITTSAADSATGDDVGVVDESVGIVDTVYFENLIPGETYTLNGTIYSRGTSSTLDSYTSSVTFVVNSNKTVTISSSTNSENYEITSIDDDGMSADGWITVTFTGIDSSELAGDTVVVYEDLVHENVTVATHATSSDNDQAVHYATISTEAMDTYTGDHVGTVWGNLVSYIRTLLGFEDADNDGIADAVQENLIDTVTLTNLVIGRTYTLSGILMNEGTDQILYVNGEACETSVTFTVSESGKTLTFSDGTAYSWEITETDTDNNSVDAKISVAFSIDTSQTAGWTVTAYEYLYHNEELITEHTDIDDTDQQVSYIEIKTHAVDSQTLDHAAAVSSESEIIDTVKLQNLVIGEDYTISGYLVFGTDYTDADGNVYKAGDKVPNVSNTQSFTATAEEKELDISFTFDSEGYEGATIVVYEEVYHNSTMIITHNDIDSFEQSVFYATIDTSAVDDYTADSVGAYTEDGVIVDTVSFDNLLCGYTYVIKGTLMDQSTGLTLNVGGKTITKEVTVTISADGKTATASDGETATILTTNDNGSVSGTVTVTFSGFDTTILSGKTAVVYERLYHTHQDCEEGVCWMSKSADDEVLITEHTEIYDKDQSVHYLYIDTEATDSETGDHVGSIWGKLINYIKTLFGNTDADGNEIEDDKQQNIIDTLTLENLVPGMTYTVTGKLMDADNETVITIDGAEIEISATFTVSEDGKSITVDSGTIDNISIEEYDEEKNYVNATMDVVYSFDSSLFENEAVTIVVYENVYHGDDDILVASHEDADDTDQSINEVSITTKAVDADTQDEVGSVKENTSIVDTISFEKLVADEEYTVKSILVDQSESSENEIVYLLDEDGNEISTSITFTANDSDSCFSIDEDDSDDFSIVGTITTTLTFTNDLVQGKAVTVVTELYHNNVLVGIHGYSYDTDGNMVIDDAEGIYYPTGKTNATDNQTTTHTSDSDEDTTITDAVYFQNLVLGEEYTINGTIYLAEDFTDADGNEYDKGDSISTSSVTFMVAEEIENAYDIIVTTLDDGTKVVSGYIPVVFSADTSALDGATIVIGEEFVHNGATIFTHYDLDDTVQTIRIPAVSTSAIADTINEASSRSFDSETGEYSWNIITITDTVSYSNLYTQSELDALAEDALLILGGTVSDLRSGEIYSVSEYATYIIKGYLVYQDTGEIVTDTDGNAVEGYTVFTPNASSGTVDVTYTIDFSKFVNEDGFSYLENKTVVVYEDLYQINAEDADIEDITDDSHIGDHKDTEDEAQMIYIPKITGELTDSIDGDTDAWATANIDLIDTVTYENLTIGNEYKITGILYDIETGEPALDDNGDEIAYETTFVCESEDGTIDLEFIFSGESLEGKTLVAYVIITRDGIDVAVHCDIEDVAQMIFIPKITTQLVDTIDSVADALASDEITLVDTITYENLLPTREYVVSGILYDQETGEPVLDDDGNMIISQTTFTPDEPDGTVTVTYIFSGESLAGKSVVSYEIISRAGKTVANHEDITDEEQTVDIPLISTSLLTDEGSKMALADDEIILIDTITYENLIEGATYTVEGILYDASTAPEIEDETDESDEEDGSVEDDAADDTNIGEETDGSSDSSTSDDTVTDSDDEESTESASSDTGEDTEETDNLSEETVSYEYTLTVNGTEDGTVYATITVAGSDGSTESYDAQFALADAEYADNTYTITIDSVTYVIPEDYVAEGAQESETVSGTISEDEDSEDAEDEEVKEPTPILDDNGDEITATTTFTAESENGTVTVVYTFSGVTLAGETVVAYETVYSSTGKTVAIHYDIYDEEQTVYIPAIDTEAKDSNGSKYVTTAATGNVTDTITYDNVVADEEYTVYGVLMDAETGKAIKDNDGNEITATVNFVPEDTSGEVEITFSVPAEAFFGKAVVYDEITEVSTGSIIAVHKDIDDEDQSVYFPEITTYLADEDEAKNIISGEEITLIDTISYSDLEVGTSYRVYGVLIDKETGEAAIDADGEEITSVIDTFICEDADGTLEMTFALNSEEMDGEYVAYEYLYKVEQEESDDDEDAIDAEEDTAENTAKDDDSLTEEAEEDEKDDAADDEATAGEEDEEAADEEENIESEEIEIIYAKHTDIEDDDQTVLLTLPEAPQTGEDYNIYLWYVIGGIVVICIAGAIIIILCRSKKRKKDRKN